MLTCRNQAQYSGDVSFTANGRGSFFVEDQKEAFVGCFWSGVGGFDCRTYMDWHADLPRDAANS
jgi:hypothetical protein